MQPSSCRLLRREAATSSPTCVACFPIPTIRAPGVFRQRVLEHFRYFFFPRGSVLPIHSHFFQKKLCVFQIEKKTPGFVSVWALSHPPCLGPVECFVDFHYRPVLLSTSARVFPASCWHVTEGLPPFEKNPQLLFILWGISPGSAFKPPSHFQDRGGFFCLNLVVGVSHFHPAMWGFPPPF